MNEGDFRGFGGEPLEVCSLDRCRDCDWRRVFVHRANVSFTLLPRTQREVGGSKGARSGLPVALPLFIWRALDIQLLLDAHFALRARPVSKCVLQVNVDDAA